MKETLKSLFLSEWTPVEKGLLMADVFLLGVVIGWLTAPLRHGFRPFIGSAPDGKSGAESAGYEEEDMDEEMDDNEEDEK